MTIGSPSGSGATQNDIANGADESDGRWMTMIDTGLTANQPKQLHVDGSGATPSFQDDGVSMGGTSDGDTGVIFAGTLKGIYDMDNTVSTVLLKVTYASSVTIANLNDNHFIGLGDPYSADNQGTKNNIAGFRPAVGNSTTGNVRVDSGGTDNDDTVTFPSIGEFHEYCVLVDYSGVYLPTGSTGFYIDSDPREGDAPQAEIAATPNLDERRPMAAYASEGNDQTMGVNFIEVRFRQ